MRRSVPDKSDDDVVSIAVDEALEFGGACLRPRTFRITRRNLLGSAALIAAAPLVGAAPASYRDAKAPIAARVADLLSRMTIEEKAAQLQCLWVRKTEILGPDRNFDATKAAGVIGQGIGQISRPSDIRGYPEWETTPFRSFANTVETVNAIQRFLVDKTRLGIPALFHDELAHGLLANDATIFPSAPALGSTWDPGLVERAYGVAAREARVRGTQVALTPVVDLARDPRWGRVDEFFGEDPEHVARMSVAAVRGLQGRTRPIGPDHVFATLKHLIHGTPQGGLNISPADMSERTLREAFLVPFARVVEEADPAIIMPSYNEFQGVPNHANVDVLQRIGRRLLGFKGAYFSDYGGIDNLVTQHHVAANKEDAAVLAMNAGVQADLPEGESYAFLPKLVREGRVSEAQVDDAVAQVLRLKFEAGLFENPYIALKALQSRTNTEADVGLARQVAQKALVLLKNDGAAPLAVSGTTKLAVIGPSAVEPYYGGYSGANSRSVTILDGLRRNAPKGMTIEHSDGVWITTPDPTGPRKSYSPMGPISAADDERRIAEAVEIAKRSDVVLLVLGDVPSVTREAVAMELPGDRSTLGLWGRQDQLVEAVAALGKPIVTLILAGRPLAIPRLAELSNALFMGWYLGQEAGNAFADVLFGKVAPGGKLAVSMPRSAGELPIYYNRHRSSDWNRYIEGERKPVFPFGHGLSYTTFEIGAPQLKRSTISPGDAAEIEVAVTNTGKRYGDEVVQIYIRDEFSSVPRPVLELKAFQRIGIAPGETRKLAFTLEPDALALWDRDMNWRVEPGDFTIFAGASSANLKSTTLSVSG